MRCGGLWRTGWWNQSGEGRRFKPMVEFAVVRASPLAAPLSTSVIASTRSTIPPNRYRLQFKVGVGMRFNHQLQPARSESNRHYPLGYEGATSPELCISLAFNQLILALTLPLCHEDCGTGSGARTRIDSRSTTRRASGRCCDQRTVEVELPEQALIVAKQVSSSTARKQIRRYTSILLSTKMRRSGRSTMRGPPASIGLKIGRRSCSPPEHTGRKWLPAESRSSSRHRQLTARLRRQSLANHCVHGPGRRTPTLRRALTLRDQRGERRRCDKSEKKAMLRAAPRQASARAPDDSSTIQSFRDKAFSECLPEKCRDADGHDHHPERRSTSSNGCRYLAGRAPANSDCL